MQVKREQIGAALVCSGGKGVGCADRWDELHVGGRADQVLVGRSLKVEAGPTGRQWGGGDYGDLVAAFDLVAAVVVGREQQLCRDVLDLRIVVGRALVDGTDAVGVGRGSAAVGGERGEGGSDAGGSVELDGAGGVGAGAGLGPTGEAVRGVVSTGGDDDGDAFGVRRGAGRVNGATVAGGHGQGVCR